MYNNLKKEIPVTDWVNTASAAVHTKRNLDKE